MNKPLSQFWITSISVVLAVVQKSNSDTSPEPKFDTTSSNVTAIEGQTAVLPCRAEHLQDRYHIVWMNPKKIVISRGDRRTMDDSRLSIERPSVPDWNLHIRKVRYDDRGMYTCTLNTRPVQVKRIYLTVAVPPKIIASWSSSKQVAREGTTVELHCNATGVPQPKITWFRKTKYKHENKELLGTPGEILIIHNITRYCDGIYECIAENGIGDSVSKEIPVEVTFPPEVALLAKRMGQYVTKETILGCNISASPLASAIWRRGQQRQPISNKSYKYRVSLYTDGPHAHSLNLRIMDIQDEDFGEYVCEATNNLGRDSENMLLFESKHFIIHKQERTTSFVEFPPLYQSHGITVKSTKATKVTSKPHYAEDVRGISYIPGGKISEGLNGVLRPSQVYFPYIEMSPTIDPERIAISDNSVSKCDSSILTCSISIVLCFIIIQLRDTSCS